MLCMSLKEALDLHSKHLKHSLAETTDNIFKTCADTQVLQMYEFNGLYLFVCAVAFSIFFLF